MLRPMVANDSIERARFFDLLAHELRGPLFPIIALSDLLMSSDDSVVGTGEWREHLSMIGRSAAEMNRMLGDLLELSRLQAEGVAPDPGTVDLAATATRLQTDAADLTTEVQGPTGVHTDRLALARCSSALATHASADTAGPVHLRFAAGAGRLILSAWVPAMSDDERTALFSPFWRREAPGNNTIRSLGLALPLVKLSCERLGGHVRAVADGDQTRLEATLPCAVSAAKPTADPHRVLFVAERLPVIYHTALVVLAAGHDARLVMHPAEADEVQRAWDPQHVVRTAGDADKVRAALGV